MSTSQLAYIKVRPSARETRRTILAFAERCGARGFTCDELAAAWQCAHNHTSPRVHELLKAGLLVPTGRTRPTRASHAAQVLVVPKFSPAKDRPVPTIPQSLFPGLEGVHRDDG